MTNPAVKAGYWRYRFASCGRMTTVVCPRRPLLVIRRYQEATMAQTAQQTILTAQDGGVLTVTFNRPEVLNAFNDQMSTELADALRQAERDASVRCLVLLGSGRGFSAGQDLSAFREREQRAEPRSIREHLKA